MASVDRDDAPTADPYRCPDCGATLVDLGGVGGCVRCGFSAAHPLATRLWEIDTEFARLGGERARLIDAMRRDRAVAPGPAITGAAAAPVASRPSLSVQALLVGLGALLVVIASVVFAAVTWDRLGAGGQAAVLATATAAATAATWELARRRLTTTAEAVSVVAAGFALLDVHAVRVALASGGDWQLSWAAGLIVVVAGLVALGRLTGLRAPWVVAVGAAQLPLMFMASLAERPALALSAAATGMAAIDHLADRASSSRVGWPPAPAPAFIRLLGGVSWLAGSALALPLALGGIVDGSGRAEQWAAIGIMAAATALAASVALTSASHRALEFVAAGGATAGALVIVVAIGRTLTGDGDLRLLVATVAPVAAIAATLPFVRRRSAAPDHRIQAAHLIAGGWSAVTLAAWSPPVLGAVLAPFLAIDRDGWWTRGLGVTTADLRLRPELADLGFDDRPTALLVAAVVTGAAGAAVWLRAALDPGTTIHRRGPAWALGAGGLIALAVVAVRVEISVALVVALHLAAVGAMVGASVWPGRAVQPWLGVAALAPAGVGVAWAGSVDALTVIALSALAAIAAAATWRGIVGDHRTWARCTTVAAGSAVTLAAQSFASALDASDAVAWNAALATVLTASVLAWVAEARVPWWASSVDLTVAGLAGSALWGLADSTGPDPVSVGLALVTLTAAAHVSRPSRRIVAALIAAAVALLLWWLRLWENDIRAVEAYSVPAAALLGAAGWRQLRRQAEVGSWAALGPALVVAGTPSVVVAIDQDGVLRPLLVLGVAVGATVAGAVGRLRSPLVIGALTALVVAIDQVWPTVARLPRWIGIGAAGLLLLVVGATFEQQRRRAAGYFDSYRYLR